MTASEEIQKHYDVATVYLDKKIIFRFDMEGNDSVKPSHVAEAIKKHFKES